MQLQESFLSKSPIKGDEVDDNVDGTWLNLLLGVLEVHITVTRLDNTFDCCAWCRPCCQSDRQLDSCSGGRGGRGGCQNPTYFLPYARTK